MKKLICIILVYILLITVTYAQQDPQISLNMFNHMAINPGYAGSNDAICAYAIIRNQWMGFENGPATNIFSVNSPIKSISSGVGLSIINDKQGFEKNLGINLAYAYRLSAGAGKLGIGLNIGMLNKSLVNTDWISPDILENPSNSIYADDAIPLDQSHAAFDLGFGAFYRTDNLYLGVSSTHISQSNINLDEGQYLFLKRHYYITAGYNYQLPNPLFELRPSVFVKSDGAASHINVNLTVLYNKKFWGGVSYRAGSDIIAMFGMEFLNGIKFALAYDYTTSDIGSYSDGSIEFMLGYSFNLSIDKSKGSYKSVRFL